MISRCLTPKNVNLFGVKGGDKLGNSQTNECMEDPKLTRVSLLQGLFSPVTNFVTFASKSLDFFYNASMTSYISLHGLLNNAKKFKYYIFLFSR